MKFISGYVWREDSRYYDAILLQQGRYKNCPILFTCIYSGHEAGKYITGQLNRWFYSRGIHLCRRTPSDGKMEKELLALLKQAGSEVGLPRGGGNLQDVHIIVMLTIGNRIWLLWRGNVRGYLLNCRFSRPHIRLLTKMQAGGECVRPETVSGRLQKGVGILLCGPDFPNNMSDELLRDCLAVQEIETEKQISRRLKELREESGKLGAKQAGSAVYIKTI